MRNLKKNASSNMVSHFTRTKNLWMPKNSGSVTPKDHYLQKPNISTIKIENKLDQALL
jgi:hypothetical protein